MYALFPIGIPIALWELAYYYLTITLVWFEIIVFFYSCFLTKYDINVVTYLLDKVKFKKELMFDKKSLIFC